MKITLILFFMTFNLLAATIPTELQLLIESVGNPGVLNDSSEATFNEDEIQTLKKQIVSIDLNLSSLNDEAAMLLIKNEIYKKILDQTETSTNLLTNQNLIEIKNRLQTSKKNLAPFLAWMLEALIIDIDTMLNKAELESFLKTANPQLKERLTNLLFYPTLFNQKSLEEFNLELKPLILTIIQNIDTVSSLLVNFSELKGQTIAKSNNTLELLFNLALKNSTVKKSLPASSKSDESEAIKALSEPIEEPIKATPTNPKTSWVPEEEPIIDIDSSILRKMEDKNYDWMPATENGETDPAKE
ncbi:MAG: hypothetical protein U0T83_09460 [Bacteriovoracaceae bacterium]